MTAKTASGAVPSGRTYVTVGGERLDQVAHAAYGIQAGVVEALLVMNPGLAAQPYLLPAGLAIELPELLPVAVGKTREVALWG